MRGVVRVVIGAVSVAIVFLTLNSSLAPGYPGWMGFAPGHVTCFGDDAVCIKSEVWDLDGREGGRVKEYNHFDARFLFDWCTLPDFLGI